MEFNYLDILVVVTSVGIGWALRYIKSRFEIREVKKELKDFQAHLNRQMQLTANGLRTSEESIVKLQSENENLRISVKTLGQKPGHVEIRLLNIYDSALRRMQLKAPGFSSAWEVALQEAEKEYEENEQGFKAIIKKVFGPSITHNTELTMQQQAEAKKEGFSN